MHPPRNFHLYVGLVHAPARGHSHVVGQLRAAASEKLDMSDDGAGSSRKQISLQLLLLPIALSGGSLKPSITYIVSCFAA